MPVEKINNVLEEYLERYGDKDRDKYLFFHHIYSIEAEVGPGPQTVVLKLLEKGKELDKDVLDDSGRKPDGTKVYADSCYSDIYTGCEVIDIIRDEDIDEDCDGVYLPIFDVGIRDHVEKIFLPGDIIENNMYVFCIAGLDRYIPYLRVQHRQNTIYLGNIEMHT